MAWLNSTGFAMGISAGFTSSPTQTKLCAASLVPRNLSEKLDVPNFVPMLAGMGMKSIPLNDATPCRLP